MKKLFLTLLVIFSSSNALAVEYLQLPAIAFRPQKHYDTSGSIQVKNVIMPHYLGGTWMRFSFAPYPVFPATLKLDAPVQLPHGATITGFECYITDNDATVNFDSYSNVVLKKASSTEQPGRGVVSQVRLSSRPNQGLATIRGALQSSRVRVDLSRFHYYAELNIRLRAKPSSWFSLQFRGCRVAYR